MNLKQALQSLDRKIKKRRRLAFIAQHTDADSGVACIAMAAAAMGCNVTMAQLLERCVFGRDGLSASDLAALARDLGIDASVCIVDHIDREFADGITVLNWRFGHWVVLERVTGNRVLLMDPSAGRRTTTIQDLSDSFTGVCLRLRGSTNNSSFSRRHQSSMKAFALSLVNDVNAAPWAIVVILTTLALQFLSLASPFLVTWALDKGIPRKTFVASHQLFTVVAALVIAHASSTLLRSLTTLHIKNAFDLTSMDRLVRRVLDRPITFFHSYTRADLIGRINGFSELRQVLNDSVISSALDGTFVLTYMVWLVSIRWQLAALVAVVGMVEIFILRLTFRRQKELGRLLYQRSIAQRTSLIEILVGIEYLKATGSEEFARRKWLWLLASELDASFQRARVFYLANMATGICTFGGPLLTIWYGMNLVGTGRMTLGEMIGAAAIVNTIFWPLSACTTAISQIQNATSNLDKLEPLLRDIPYNLSMSLPTVAQQKADFVGHLNIQDVTYSYPGCTTPSLNRVSVEAYPGETIAIVGKSGSGKSTLGMLAIGLLRPDEGTALLDGIDGVLYSSSILRRRIGAVLQSSVMLRASICENVRFGLDELTFDQVVNACKLAHIHDDIVALPLGYDTMMADGGNNFSGGQRQRIALARALAREPAMLLLDEATSQLDVETEGVISSMLSEQTCSQVLIAHRLSTVRRAKRIYVLESGRVVQVGSYQELSSTDGVFREMLLSS